MAESGEAAFKRQLYHSMVGQLLFLKTEIEGWRSQVSHRPTAATPYG